jgi:hypothetical protein
MNDNNLFVSILDTVATAEAAKQYLREAIFWTVVNTTAMNRRVTDSDYLAMKLEADGYSFCIKAEFYCDDKIADTFNFKQDNSQHQLRILQRLYDLVVQYHTWYEDADIDGDNNNGLCWYYNNHHYSLIFSR